MFEKESKEYARKNTSYYGTDDCYDTDTEKVEQVFKDAAEFGYNKANEWHYVKDELPPEDVPILCNRGGNIYVAWFILGKWKGDKYNDVKKPYAWKEIVLPELPKESE